MKKLPISLSVFFLLLSCTQEPLPVEVARDFQPYVDQFVNEALQRGLEVDFSDTGLIIEFGSVPPDAAAVCKGRGDANSGSHHIVIKKSFWNNSTPLQQERLIFHELGHCELNRGHRNDTLPNGEWSSIMRGSPLPENIPVYTNFTGTRRQYYIDELFDESTPQPAWVNIKADYGAVDPNARDTLLFLQNVKEINEVVPNAFSGNFELEMEYKLVEGISFGGLAWGGSSISNSYHAYVFNGTRFHIGSGLDIWGIVREFQDLVTLGQFNTITIRRVEDKYFYFWNRRFIYWMDVEEILGVQIKTLAGPNVELDIKRLLLTKIRG